ncbi:hypothetical protein EON65_10315 [archaeon]|nr:MAG: hypothetical protein EON65_10315 [archaeon]
MNFTKPALISKRPRLMQINDLVVIFERHDSLDHLVIKPGKVFQNKYGAFHHSDMIGKPFGTKIKSRTSSGYIYVLEPTPELWSSAVYVS